MSPPEDGKNHWPLMIAGLTTSAMSYGLARYGYGLFLPRIRAEFDLDTQSLGFIASATYIGYIAATLLGSLLSGRIGPRLPIVLGGVCATLGMGMIAATDSLPLFITGSVIAGLSAGLCYTPLSDAVVLMVSSNRRDRVYAISNSGTSLGVLISGPVALFASGDWRLAWAAFAGFALLTTLWSGKTVTSDRLRHRTDIQRPLHLRRRGSLPLFSFAFILGVSSAAYWTYSVDFLQSVGGRVNLPGLSLGPEKFSLAFWSLVGIAGFLSGFAGDAVARLGLTRCIRAGSLILATAIMLLVQFPDNAPLLSLSAIFFGILFPTMAGFLGMWTINVFYDRPSAGFGASFLILSIGQFVGPSLYGIIANRHGMEPAFYLAAILCLCMLATRPAQDIRSMTPVASSAD